VNLSQVGNSNNNEDSSSEETSPVGGKPGIRPRSTSIDRTHTGYFPCCCLIQKQRFYCMQTPLTVKFL